MRFDRAYPRCFDDALVDDDDMSLGLPDRSLAESESYCESSSSLSVLGSCDVDESLFDVAIVVLCALVTSSCPDESLGVFAGRMVLCDSRCLK